MATIKRLTGGRAGMLRLTVLLAVLAVVGFWLATLPAQGASVFPDPVEHIGGGAPQDCTAPDVLSPAGNFYGVPNPVQVSDDAIEDPNNAGVWIKITSPADPGTLPPPETKQSFDFVISDSEAEADAGTPSPRWQAANVIAKGSKKSNNYDYFNDTNGPQASDTNLVPPKKGQKFQNLSHVSICYDEFVTIEGLKWHDHDSDGAQDNAANEPGIDNWLISVFDSGGSFVASTLTDDGDYLISLVGGTYTVCEEADGPLPDGVNSSQFSWTQSALSTTHPRFGFWNPTICTGLVGQDANGNDVDQALAGYSVTPSVTRIDFPNHLLVSLACGETAVLGGSTGGGGIPGVGDPPLATVTLPTTNCTSSNFSSSFDVGLSTDPSDDFRQFAVFGGTGAGVPIAQTIVWSPEDGDYTTTPGELTVPTTQVIIPPSGTPQPVVFCNTLTGGVPNTTTTDCLDSRTIAEGSPLPEGKIQLTENYLFLGDPPRFR